MRSMNTSDFVHLANPFIDLYCERHHKARQDPALRLFIMLDRQGEPSQDEHQLLALYAQYPEISFDSKTFHMDQETESELPASLQSELESGLIDSHDQQPSSPGSTITALDGDDCDLTDISGTTAHTTPLRDLGTTIVHGQTYRRVGTITDKGTLEHYLQLVENKRVPAQLYNSFTSLGTTIANIGQDLFPIDPNRPLPHIDSIYARCKLLLRALIQGNLDITNQREKVAYLKSLRAFQTNPTDQYVWTAFKQRADLICTHASCPRKQEKDLIDALVVLFHIQMYGPFMDFIEKEESMEERFMRIFEAMLDKITTWLSLYNRWWADMVDLKQNYTVPLWNRICTSEEIGVEVREQQLIHQMADSVDVTTAVPNWLND